MGLDMYLYARKRVYVGTHIDESNGTIKVELPEELKMFDGIWDKTINVQTDFTIGYWRKANHIHKFFVDKCANGEDDCRDVYVSKENLEELLKLCNEVLAEHGDAESKLPTQNGFFFGGTEYDEWYFNQTKRTKEICEKAIQFLNEREKAKDYLWEIVYQASW